MIWRTSAITSPNTAPSFNDSTIRKLYRAARSLEQSPNRGRIGQKEGARELVMAPLPYIIVYGVEPGMAHMFRILHTAQDRIED